jgi:hypothetical protein
MLGTPDFWIAAFTVVLAIATILLWISTKRLAVLAGNQADDFRSSIEVMRQANLI